MYLYVKCIFMWNVFMWSVPLWQMYLYGKCFYVKCTFMWSDFMPNVLCEMNLCQMILCQILLIHLTHDYPSDNTCFSLIIASTCPDSAATWRTFRPNLSHWSGFSLGSLKNKYSLIVWIKVFECMSVWVCVSVKSYLPY